MEHNQAHRRGHKSLVFRILTSKLFAIKILPAHFANPAPSRTFGGRGGRGVPPKTPFSAKQKSRRASLFCKEIHSKLPPTSHACLGCRGFKEKWRGSCLPRLRFLIPSRFLRRLRSDPRSSPCSTPLRSLSRTSPSHPTIHRLRPTHATASANRRSGRHEYRST
jgi:hypothetical protein